MMLTILKSGVQELIRRINLARLTISKKEFPQEVYPCFEWVMLTLSSFCQELNRIQKQIDFGLDDNVLHQAWYNQLAGINNELEVIDTYFIHPLYRISKEDRLALKLIEWLHKSHPVTRNKAFILSNGSFSIAPSEYSPTIYWLPVTSQLSILHFPLFFHEFGHQLFLLHKIEMEDLIAEFQNKLSGYLRPLVSQDDETYLNNLNKGADIVETWREWMEELFCDAVGLTIGGKAYLGAFSHFIRLGGVKEFFVQEKYLSKRSHPVSLLRVRFLAERARTLGLGSEADQLEQEWNELVHALGVREDYFGYFEDYYMPDISTLLDDMLTQADPITFDRIEDTKELHGYYILVQSAWDHFLTDPNSYPNWEYAAINDFLQSIEKNNH